MAMAIIIGIVTKREGAKGVQVPTTFCRAFIQKLYPTESWALCGGAGKDYCVETRLDRARTSASSRNSQAG
jgi:hypothetical protein